MSDPVFTTVEVVGTSGVDVTQAVQNAVDKASETLRHISWFELVTVRGSVEEGTIKQFQATVNIGFRLE
jgi:flavin-binding protein dodecin